MLSTKPWKPEAILRLFLGVVVCVFMGAVFLSVVQFLGGSGKVAAPVFFGLVAGALVFLGGVLILVVRPWPVEKFARYFLSLLVCLYLGLTLGYLAQHFTNGIGAIRPVLRVVIAALSCQGAALVLIHHFLQEHQTSWADAFGLHNRAWLALLSGVVVTCLYLPMGWILQWAAVQVLSHLGANPQAQDAVEVLRNTEGWADRLAFGVIAIALVPVAEEMLFRGILYPTIKRAGFPRAALWGTAVLFALVHQNLPAFLPLLLLAVALTALYEATDNLLAPIVAHSLFNALNFAALYWSQNPLAKTPGP